jgi:hypothetical protein
MVRSVLAWTTEVSHTISKLMPVPTSNCILQRPFVYIFRPLRSQFLAVLTCSVFICMLVTAPNTKRVTISIYDIIKQINYDEL